MSGIHSEERRVVANGVATRIRIDEPAEAKADTPWITFANSLVCALEMWDAQVPAFARDFRVLRYDMRGHGGTDAPPPPYAIADLAADMLAVWDTLGIRRSHVVGLSLGGMVGLHLASRHPERIVTLTASDCRAEAVPAYAKVFEERVALTRAEGMAALVEPTLQRFFTPEFSSANPDAIAAFRRMIAETTADGHVGCCEAIIGLNETPHLPRIAAPTLCIGGARDIGAPPEVMAGIAAAIPGARHVVIPGAGHISCAEQPDVFNEHLAAFIRAA
ncbi:MAG TPA: 3-oxoadipate enol-lactonase [Xanthobacteraceae bacterium]|nr:3-oxoadipate enol-lactonase [Xanthobacteraceae bacterium]